MKKHPIITFLLFLIIQTNILTEDLIITVACEDKNDYPSVLGNGYEISDNKPGLAIELLKNIEKELQDINFEFIRYPWIRCLDYLKNGDVDALIPVSYKDVRKKNGHYPMKDEKVDPARRYYDIKYVLYTRKDSNKIWDGKNFSSIDGRVGAPKGYSIVDDLKKNNVLVIESNDTLIDLKNLARKRLDYVAALEKNGDYYITKNKSLTNKIIKLEPELISKPYYLMFSHQFYNSNKQLAEKIWNLVAKTRESKQFKAIEKKYFE